MKLTDDQIAKKLSVFYWTWSSLLHSQQPTLPLSRATWNQPTISHLIFSRYFFILSLHLCLYFCYHIQYSCYDRHTSLYKTYVVSLEYWQSVTEWQLSQYVWYKTMVSTVSSGLQLCSSYQYSGETYHLYLQDWISVPLKQWWPPTW